MKQSSQTVINAINSCARKKKPFLFIIDFDCKYPIVRLLDDIDPNEILFDFKGFTNLSNLPANECKSPFYFRKFPIPYPEYKLKFDRVKKDLLNGNSYLLNLTYPTPIETNLSLKEIFMRSNAPFKLLYNRIIRHKNSSIRESSSLNNGGSFVVFSPESFVTIRNGIINSFPMKGTINASIPHAESIIMDDKKELAEHSTIVDLIRNDLSMVAHHVKLKRFRYVERIKTNHSALLQVSSEITGKVKKEYLNNYGKLLSLLLPAGSISGAPKRKTLEIIKKTEGYKRGYYTGVFGYSDGKNLESAVMIRYVENNDKKLFFKSGGGITVYSNPESEYQELIDKVYVPFN